MIIVCPFAKLIVFIYIAKQKGGKNAFILTSFSEVVLTFNGSINWVEFIFFVW